MTAARPSRALVISADDGGCDPAIDEAIRRSAFAGGLTSVSAMAGGPVFEALSDWMRGRPDLGVGVHLTWVGGRPCEDPARVPSLVGAEGFLRPDWRSFTRDWWAGRIALADCVREGRAQIARFRQAGLCPDHLDGHQHLHVLPGLASAVVGLARESGIAGLRLPRPCRAEPRGWPAGVRSAVLAGLSSAVRPGARAAGLDSPDECWGMHHAGRVDAALIAACAAASTARTAELVFHPAADNRGMSGPGWERYDGESELRLLESGSVRRILGAWGWAPVRYADLRVA